MAEKALADMLELIKLRDKILADEIKHLYSVVSKYDNLN